MPPQVYVIAKLTEAASHARPVPEAATPATEKGGDSEMDPDILDEFGASHVAGEGYAADDKRRKAKDELNKLCKKVRRA